MKDSGIPWIGEIPKDWSIDKVVRLFNNIGSGTTPKSTEDSNFNGTINWIQSGDINGGILEKCKNKISQNVLTEYSALRVYNAPFIIIAMYGASVGNSSLSIIDGSVNQACCVLSNSTLDKDYSFGVIQSCKDYWLRKAVGGGQPNISQDTIKSTWLPVPPLTVQKAIAEFLDRKCGEINELVALQDKMIEELKAYKQSIITETVTKGLNPNVPLKDSGIEWVGQIPQHWKVSKIKNENDILDYLRQPISADKRINELGLYDYYGASGVIDKIDDYNVEDKVLLIGEDGANLIFRNLPLIYKAEGKFWVNNHAHILKVKSYNDYTYMYYMLEAGDYFLYITGSAQPKLSQENLKNFVIPIPPLSEQQEIADFLDKKCSEIDSLIDLKQQKIEELKDYKKSIIYEYVTGKKQII